MGRLSRGLGIEACLAAGLAVATVTLAAGCTTPRMAAPEDVSSASEVLPVSGRSRASGLFVDEGFKLGPYTVADVDRKWDSNRGIGIGPWSKETKTTGYSFSLSRGADRLKGKCESELKQQGIAIFGGTMHWGGTTIACACEGDAGEASLVLSRDTPRLRVGGSEYVVKPLYGVAGGSDMSTPTGYRADADGPVGAVEVLYPGQIWLHDGLDEGTKASVTCLFTGLMLYRPPSGE